LYVSISGKKFDLLLCLLTIEKPKYSTLHRIAFYQLLRSKRNAEYLRQQLHVKAPLMFYACNYW